MSEEQTKEWLTKEERETYHKSMLQLKVSFHHYVSGVRGERSVFQFSKAGKQLTSEELYYGINNFHFTFTITTSTRLQGELQIRLIKLLISDNRDLLYNHVIFCT